MSKITCKINDDGTIDEIHKIVVHRFLVGDVEDPDLYAAQPLWKWEKSEQGQFVMNNAVEKPEWRRTLDYSSYSYRYAVTARLEKKKLSEFYLRWGKIG